MSATTGVDLTTGLFETSDFLALTALNIDSVSGRLFGVKCFWFWKKSRRAEYDMVSGDWFVFIDMSELRLDGAAKRVVMCGVLEADYPEVFQMPIFPAMLVD